MPEIYGPGRFQLATFVAARSGNDSVLSFGNGRLPQVFYLILGSHQNAYNAMAHGVPKVPPPVVKMAKSGRPGSYI